MITLAPLDAIPVGTFVKIRHSGFDRAVIVEYRGKLGPNGSRVYGVLGYEGSDPPYLVVREDQLEVLPDQRPALTT
jgi:hypothetical protein